MTTTKTMSQTIAIPAIHLSNLLHWQFKRDIGQRVFVIRKTETGGSVSADVDRFSFYRETDYTNQWRK